MHYAAPALLYPSFLGLSSLTFTFISYLVQYQLMELPLQGWISTNAIEDYLMVLESKLYLHL